MLRRRSEPNVSSPPPTRLPLPCSIRLVFIPLCLVGIVESPAVVWNGKSTIIFKIYSGLLCVLTLVGCLRTSYLCYQLEADPLLRVLDPKPTFYCRLFYTVVAFKALACRLVCFIIFNFKHQRIAEAHSQIAGDPILNKSFRWRVAPFIWFHLVVSVAMIFSLIMNLRIAAAQFRLVESDYVLVLITNVISTSPIAYGHGFLSLVASVTVCDVLRRGRSYFIDAVRSQRVEGLQEAIELHKKGHELVRALNMKFRYLLGVSLSTAVPLFAAVCTFLSTSHGHEVTEMMILMYIAILLSITAVIISVTVASRVNSELEMHAEVLRESDVDDEKFEKVSSRFLRQFNKRPGFTFFGSGTVTRETGLTAFGLMTNYYIVGIQLDNMYK